MRTRTRCATSVAMILGLVLFAASAFSGEPDVGQTAKAELLLPPAGTPRYNIFPGPPYSNGEGEPAIGVNWQCTQPSCPADFSGTVMYQYGFDALWINFDDCGSPAAATWANRSNPANSASLDPIGFVDRDTGRAFTSQLNGACSFTSFSNDDGHTWIPSEGCGPPAGPDHQTIGGGPFHAGPTDCHTPAYPNAVYYCSQYLLQPGPATCAMSCDGGVTFGPGVPAWTTQCGGIHGHVKVASDGTVYVPNRNCGGKAGVAVSEDNGATWTVRVAPTTTSPLNGYLIDPSLGVDSSGRIYVGYQRSDGRAFIVTSGNKGVDWEHDQDVGAALGIQNSTFPAVVGGSAGRAAYAFLGTTTAGAFSNVGFPGVWHLYIATTFDAGVTWTTVDATPNDPVQRGSICVQGTTICCTPGSANCTRTVADRNLLDFNDVTIDKFGRVVAAFTDGCITSRCINGGPNDYTAAEVIARQSGGKRLIDTYDPNPPEPAPPAPPRINAYRTAPGVAHVVWSTPDDGGSPITGYNIYRGPASGSETFLAGIGVQNTYDDITADAGTAYFYEVRAVNATGVGVSCGEKMVPGEFHPPEGPCVIPGVKVSLDTGDAQPNAPPDPAVDIHSAYIAEPDFGPGVNKLAFTLFVGQGPAPPSSQWYIIWSRPSQFTNPDRSYVAMKTDATGAVSFEYGRVASASANPPTVPTTLGAADFGSFDPTSGTIYIEIANSKVDNVAAGALLNAISPRTFYARANGAPVTQSTCSDFSDPGTYTLVGNFYCRFNETPFALLKSSVSSGCAPLTVNYDASGSYDPDGDGVVSYTFDFGDGHGSMTQSTPLASHTYDSFGDYQTRLVVTDGRGGVSQNFSNAMVHVDPPPTASASGSATICQGGSTALSGSGGTSCTWSPATGLSDPNSCAPTASPSQTTTYSLTVTDANGCVSANTATATVTVEPVVTSEASPTNWTGASKDALSWPAVANATSYRVYRGVESELPNLLDSSTDSCLRLETSMTATDPVLTENPADPGGLYWYLVVGVACGGDGPAGDATAGPRIVNSGGACP